jgi:uncharacterized protein
MTDDQIRQVIREMLGPMGEHREVALKDMTANPAPLGLMAFGLTTVLLNLHNAGLFGMSTMILAMGLSYGGVAQIIAGIMEWKKNSTFGVTVLTSFGLFWLSLVVLLLLPEWTSFEAPDGTAMGWYMFCWGVFVCLLFIATLRISRALQIAIVSVAVLFFLLAIEQWTGNETLGKVAGWEGIWAGLTAIYVAMAQLWNDVWEREIFPLGAIRK